MALERVALDVDTIRCEADEDAVVDALLARDGVVDAEVDLLNERVRLRFDPGVTTRDSLVDALTFFGITVQGDAVHAAVV